MWTLLSQKIQTDFGWLITPSGALFSLILTVVVSFLGIWLPPLLENRKLRGRHRIDTVGQWRSTHNRMRIGVYNSQTGEWCEEPIKVRLQRGKYRFESVDQDSEMAWIAEGSLFKNDYIYGSWWSRKTEGVEGVMALLVHPDGKSLSGIYIGRNNNAKANEIRLGPWVMAVETGQLGESGRGAQLPERPYLGH